MSYYDEEYGVEVDPMEYSRDLKQKENSQELMRDLMRQIFGTRKCRIETIQETLDDLCYLLDINSINIPDSWEVK